MWPDRVSNPGPPTESLYNPQREFKTPGPRLITIFSFPPIPGSSLSHFFYNWLCAFSGRYLKLSYYKGHGS